jgi:pyruvate ferredoxin oxidoreductase gamma subunit/2-oxoisovalerate ferredoxin oxidoreductase gamma subunit
MIAVRFHGRGGQGTVIASKLLACAMFREGWQVQAFPSFGAERSGAPVAAFLRADRRPITIHYQVYEPDHVVVLDAVLLGTVDVTAGLKPGGTILVNTSKRPEELRLPGGFVVGTCDATGIALRHGLGTRTMPIVNTAMTGAWAALTKAVSLDAIVAEVPGLVPVKADANVAAAKDAYTAVTMSNHEDHEALKAHEGAHS